MAEIMSGSRSHYAHRSASTPWEKRVSNHIAYALLVYTGLQIFVVMGAMKSSTGSILPYFGLVVLVGLIIPGCRKFEKRWELIGNSELSDASLALLYRRDRLGIWLMAIGLPFAFVALFKLIAFIF